MDQKMDQKNAANFLKLFRKYQDTDRQRTLASRDLQYHFKDIRSLVTANEYRVLKGRLVEGKTLTHLGKELGDITRQRVAQIEARAIERLIGIAQRSPHVLPEVDMENK